MDGIIIIDKPAGLTSAEVVRRVKAGVKPSRVGHLGTLDPFATGVLPIMIGEATKLASMLDGGEKEYRGVIRLGAETDTLDRDGKTVREAALPEISTARLAEITARFTGRIEQVPPVFSAIKREGVRMYTLARKGEPIEAPPARMVEIKRLSLEGAAPDSIRFSLLCSPGTYVRSLARDLAIALGTAGHLSELQRTRNGSFEISRATTLGDALERLGGAPDYGLISLRDAVPELAEVEVPAELERRLRNGDSRSLDSLVPARADLFKVICNGQLAAIAKATSRVTATIVRVFNA